ncbi:hypothetical protein SUGI_0502540 [Cryptomeria japonica]|nr:hypothetical protein SUGI_0502540 [Cryptomeria japonica]
MWHHCGSSMQRQSTFSFKKWLSRVELELQLARGLPLMLPHLCLLYCLEHLRDLTKYDKLHMEVLLQRLALHDPIYYVILPVTKEVKECLEWAEGLVKRVESRRNKKKEKPDNNELVLQSGKTKITPSKRPSATGNPFRPSKRETDVSRRVSGN